MPIKPLPKDTTIPDVGTFDVSGGFGAGPAAGASLIPYLVSIYKNRAAREAALEGTKRAVQVLPDSIRGAWDYFIQEYPRIAAHLKPMASKSSSRNASAEAFSYTLPIRDGRKASIAYTNKGTSKDGVRTIDTAFHEGTHVAQALGNKDFNELYQLSSALFGYTRNPFEQAARHSGGVRAGLQGPMGESAISALQKLVEGNAAPEAQRIREILARRLK